MPKLIIFVIGALIYSCNLQNTNNSDLEANEGIELKPESSDRVKGTVLQRKSFNHKVQIEVIDATKSADYPSSADDSTICTEWTLSKTDIQNIVSSATAINGSDWHVLFDHLPCQVSGQLKQSKEIFDFAINGGSWLTIDCGDTTLMYGNFNKDLEHLFLSPVWEDELTTKFYLDSSHCNRNTLLKIHKSFDNLTEEIISELLSAFHKDCHGNVEFSEWSNELLYRTFDEYTKEVMDLMTNENTYEMESILTELASPIHDGIMPQPLIDKIKKMGYNNQVADQILEALQIAADKY